MQANAGDSSHFPAMLTSQGRDSFTEALRDARSQRFSVLLRTEQGRRHTVHHLPRKVPNVPKLDTLAEVQGEEKSFRDERAGAELGGGRVGNINDATGIPESDLQSLAGTGISIGRCSLVRGSIGAAGWREAVAESIALANAASDDDDHQIHGGGDEDVPLYSPPLQRQRWGDPQILPHINWGDLFFDLFYVAAAYNLGGLLISALSADLWFHGVIYFVGIFGPLYSMWEFKVYYDARFATVDYVHRIVDVIRVFLLSRSVMHITPLELMVDPQSAETFGFTLGIFLESLVRVGLLLDLVRAGRGDKEAIRNHSTRILMMRAIPLAMFYFAAVLIAALQLWGQWGKDESLFHEEYDGHLRLLAPASGKESDSTQAEDPIVWSVTDIPIILCLAAYILDLLFTKIRKSFWLPRADNFRKQCVPLNIDFCIHRYGEWIMLMLGESVLSLLIVDTVESFDYYLVAAFGALTVILIQLLHFESEPSHADHHALWRNVGAGATYSILLQLLSMALIAFGVSYKVMLKNIHKTALKAAKSSSGYDGGKRRLVGGGSSVAELLRQMHRHLAPATASSSVTAESAASLFCGSLAVVLVAYKLMAYSHEGIRLNVQRMVRNAGHVQSSVLLLFDLGVILFAATLSQWLVDPRWVTLTGFFVVLSMAMSRVIALKTLSSRKDNEKGQSESHVMNESGEV